MVITVMHMNYGEDGGFLFENLKTLAIFETQSIEKKNFATSLRISHHCNALGVKTPIASVHLAPFILWIC